MDRWPLYVYIVTHPSLSLNSIGAYDADGKRAKQKTGQIAVSRAIGLVGCRMNMAIDPRLDSIEWHTQANGK